jgi:hypothetical protein
MAASLVVVPEAGTPLMTGRTFTFALKLEMASETFDDPLEAITTA